VQPNLSPQHRHPVHTGSCAYNRADNRVLNQKRGRCRVSEGFRHAMLWTWQLRRSAWRRKCERIKEVHGILAPRRWPNGFRIAAEPITVEARAACARLRPVSPLTFHTPRILLSLPTPRFRPPQCPGCATVPQPVLAGQTVSLTGCSRPQAQFLREYKLVVVGGGGKLPYSPSMVFL
jgi:hypothetical protein